MVGRARVLEFTQRLCCALAIVFPLLASGEPACVDPSARNYVLASGPSAAAGVSGGQWVLQNVRNDERIFLRRCGFGADCYFAKDVPPGRYYFEEVVGSVNDQLQYLVSRETLWFDITGQGVDFIGDWTIERTMDRVVQKLEVKYPLKKLDQMMGLCKIQGKRLFLDRTTTLPSEIVD